MQWLIKTTVNIYIQRSWKIICVKVIHLVLYSVIRLITILRANQLFSICLQSRATANEEYSWINTVSSAVDCRTVLSYYLIDSCAKEELTQTVKKQRLVRDLLFPKRIKKALSAICNDFYVECRDLVVVSRALIHTLQMVANMCSVASESESILRPKSLPSFSVYLKQSYSKPWPAT